MSIELRLWISVFVLTIGVCLLLDANLGVFLAAYGAVGLFLALWDAGKVDR